MMRPVLMVTAMAAAVVLSSGGPAAAAVNPATSPWTPQATPLPPQKDYGELNGVSCASAVKCVAVGGLARRTDLGAGLAEIWNGTKWVPHTIPEPGAGQLILPEAVSCPAADSCVLVGVAGLSGTSVAMAWNGATWTVMPGSQLASATLQGISCVSVSDCTAVGSSADPEMEPLA